MHQQGDGWRFFAATVLGLAGIMRVFDAIWAWTYNGPLPENLQNALLGHSLDTYGWVYLVVAIILFGASFGVLAGSQISRWIGIVGGAILAISAVWWMPYYPIWSLTYIAIGVHGHVRPRRVRRPPGRRRLARRRPGLSRHRGSRVGGRTPDRRGGPDVRPAVRLRSVEDRDLAVFFDHQADPQAVEMAAFPARDKDQFAAHWAKVRGDDTLVARTIVADGLVAGNIGSWPENGQQLLGYWVGREWWGRGVATQALALLLDEVPIRPIYAHVAVRNVGSTRVLEKCGFQRDRVQEAKAPAPDDGIKEFIFVLNP